MSSIVWLADYALILCGIDRLSFFYCQIGLHARTRPQDGNAVVECAPMTFEVVPTADAPSASSPCPGQRGRRRKSFPLPICPRSRTYSSSDEPSRTRRPRSFSAPARKRRRSLRLVKSAVQINVAKGSVSAVLVHATFDHACLDGRVKISCINSKRRPSSHRHRRYECCGHDATLGHHEVVGADGVFRGHELKVMALLLQLHHQFDVVLLRREYIDAFLNRLKNYSYVGKLCK